MRYSIIDLQRHIALCLVLLMAAPFGNAGTTPQQIADNSDKSPAQAQSAAGQTSPASSQQNGLQSAPEPQQSAKEPVGTAVAPYERPVGIAASRPAGAAIAPEKQKRSRSILIRVGIVAAAAVAVGTVAALSKGSPSTPR